MFTIEPRIVFRFRQEGGPVLLSKSSRDFPASASLSMGENIIDWDCGMSRNSGGGILERYSSNFGRYNGAARRANTTVAGTGVWSEEGKRVVTEGRSNRGCSGELLEIPCGRRRMRMSWCMSNLSPLDFTKGVWAVKGLTTPEVSLAGARLSICWWRTSSSTRACLATRDLNDYITSTELLKSRTIMWLHMNLTIWNLTCAPRKLSCVQTYLCGFQVTLSSGRMSPICAEKEYWSQWHSDFRHPSQR